MKANFICQFIDTGQQGGRYIQAHDSALNTSGLSAEVVPT